MATSKSPNYHSAPNKISTLSDTMAYLTAKPSAFKLKPKEKQASVQGSQ